MGILDSQPVLTFPDMEGKLAAFRAGLGVGWLPSRVAREEAISGRLVIKPVKTQKQLEVFYLAWRRGEGGKALDWWLSKLRGKNVFWG